MEQEKENKKRSRRIIILIPAIIIFICASAYIGYYFYNIYVARQDQPLTGSSSQSVSATENFVENPIDFSSLCEQNDEIYAWIKIEGTNIDYPIVQSKSDDEFYLKHSAYDKKWIASGAVYTEGCNRTDFSDPVTVVYGHNGYSDTMFTTLHYFEKPDFFEEHEYFNVYLKNRKLTYQVISAFKYDDRHIMNSFDFNYLPDLEAFQSTVINPGSALKNVRTKPDVQIDESSKIIVLSTCITNQKSNRYLVCGVLVKDEKTN